MKHPSFSPHYEQEIVRHLCMGQEGVVSFLSHLIDSDKYSALLKSLRRSKPPIIYRPVAQMPNTTYFYYSLSILLNEERPDFDLMPYYLNELKVMNKRWSDSLFYILTVPEFQYSNRSLCNAVLSLLKICPPLFRTLQDLILRFLTKVPSRELIDEFHLDLFQIMRNIDQNLLSSFDFKALIDPTNVGKFLQNTSILFSDQVSKLVQIVFGVAEPYPLKSKLFRSPPHFTLMNDCVLKRQYFVDIIARYSRSKLGDFNLIKEIWDAFPEMIPYLYLVNLQAVNNEVLECLAHYGHDPCDIFKRMHGDEFIESFFKVGLGLRVSLEELKTHSIVYFLEESIGKLQFSLLESLRKHIFLVLTDEERERDMDCILGAVSMNAILTGNSDLLHKVVPLISKESVLIDLFSLLFVKNKNGEYVCSFDIAESVISVLSAVWKKGVDYLAAAAARVVIGKHISSENSLGKCFLDPVGIVSDLFSMRDYKQALEVSEPIPRLHKLCQIADAMDQQRRTFSSPVIEDRDVVNAFNLEYCLSTFDKVDYALDSCHMSDDVRQILLNRNETSILDRMICVPRQKTLESLTNRINDFFQGNTNEIISKQNDFLNGFMRYLELFRKFAGVDATTIQDIMDSIIQSDAIPDWRALSDMLGDNALEKLLSSCDIRKASAKLVGIVKEISEIIALVVQLSAGISEEIVEYNSVMKRWKEQREMIVDSSDQSSLYDCDYKCIRDQLLNASGSLDIDSICDLRYRFWDEFTEDIAFYQDHLTFKQFMIVFPEYLEFIFADVDHENAQPVSVIDKLFSTGQINVAYHVGKKFELEKYFMDKLVAAVQLNLENGTDVSLYFKDCEHLATKAYALLPRRFHNSKNQLIFLKIEDHSQDLEVAVGTEYESCKEILRLFPSLDCDCELLELARREMSHSTNDIATMFHLANDFVQLMKNPHPVVSIICERIFEKVDRTKVDTIESERNALSVLHTALNVLRHTKYCLAKASCVAFAYETQVLKIEFLLKFASNLVYSKFGREYSFANFQQPSFLVSIAEICSKVDMNAILGEINGLWPLAMNTVRLTTLLNIVQLGLLEQARNFIHKQARYHLKSESDVKLVYHLKELLTHPIPVDIVFGSIGERRQRSLSSTFGDANLPPDDEGLVISDELAFSDKRLKVIPIYWRTRGILAIQEIHPDQPDILESFLALFEEDTEQIMIHSTLGHLSLVFGHWTKLPLAQRTFNMAMKTMILPSISSGNWSLLWKYVKSHPDARQAFENVLQHLFEYCSSHNLKATLVDIQFTLGLYENAIFSLMRFLSIDSTWEDKMKDVRLLVDALQRESDFRSKNMEGHNPKIPDKELVSLVNVAGLQSLFIRLAIDQNIPFTQNLDLLRGLNQVEEIAALAFYYKKFNLGIQVVALNPGCMPRVADMVLDKLNNQGLGDYFLQMKRRLDRASYESLCTDFLQAVALRAANRKDVPRFVVSVVSGVQLQIHILGTLGFLQEALQIADRSRDRDGVLTLLSIARRQGDKSVEQKCAKILARL